MASFNRVILVGNVTRDIELRHIPSGTAVTDLSIAVNERIKRNEQWVDDVNFFDVTLWGRTAEIASMYLQKGSPVLIEGRLKQDTWEQEDGQKRSKVKIIGERMQMLGAKSGNAPHASPSDSTSSGSSSAPVATSLQSAPPDDEVPF